MDLLWTIAKQITAFAAALILPFLPSQTKTYTHPTVAPAPTVQETLLVTISAPTPTPVPSIQQQQHINPTNTPAKISPTLNPNLVEFCDRTDFHYAQYSGFKCLATETGGPPNMDDKIKSTLHDICIAAPSQKIFEECTQSIHDNLTRLKESILSSPSRQYTINECLNKVTPVGNNRLKDWTKDSYTRSVMFDYANDLYQACFKTEGTIKNYIFQ
jgi:hypothetical protein